MAEQAASLDGFTNAAKALSGSPLGIVALFVVLLYGLASLVTVFSGSLSSAERTPLIYFLVFFPFAVLGVFGWLVSQHPTSLYAPKDFTNEDNYVRTVALLAAATGRSSSAEGGQGKVDVAAIITTVEQSRDVRGRNIYESHKRLLWVDDRPENNVLERQALESTGFEITLALSTQQALALVNAGQFDAIISDMGRKEGPAEGYNVLQQIRAKGDQTPFFIYAGSNSAQHRREAIQRGAQGSTNDPNELFRLVTGAAS